MRHLFQRGIRATLKPVGIPRGIALHLPCKDKTLYIPTAFCSYSGEILIKTPLLIDGCDKPSRLRVLRALETQPQEGYLIWVQSRSILVDRDLFMKRKDLIYTGRTLLDRIAKGQEMGDQYYASIKRGFFPLCRIWMRSSETYSRKDAYRGRSWST